MAETVIDHLLKDHQQFLKFFHEIDLLSRVPPLRRDDRQAAQRVAELQIYYRRHLRRESEILFPALKKEFDLAQTCVLEPSILNHLTEEHAIAGRTLYLLREQLSSRPPKVLWPKTFRVLRREMTDHFRREEENLFPMAASLLGQEKMESLGHQIDLMISNEATAEVRV